MPWEVAVPWLPASLKQRLSSLHGVRVLVIHQQFAACRVRELLPDCQVSTGCFFKTFPGLTKPGDMTFSGEDDFVKAVDTGRFDAVIGDPVLKRAVPEFRGEWIPFTHFAVSGALEKEGAEEVAKS